MASEHERRARLLSHKDAVRAFFERTSLRAPAQAGADWLDAFRAVQKNDYLAESFVEELRALIEFIEKEFEAPSRVAAKQAFHEETTAIKAAPLRSSRDAAAPPPPPPKGPVPSPPSPVRPLSSPLPMRAPVAGAPVLRGLSSSASSASSAKPPARLAPRSPAPSRKPADDGDTNVGASPFDDDAETTDRHDLPPEPRRRR